MEILNIQNVFFRQIKKILRKIDFSKRSKLVKLARPAKKKKKLQILSQLDIRKNNCIYQKLFGRTPDEFGAAF